MFGRLKRWLARLFASLKGGIARLFRRPPPVPGGRWIGGHHHEPRGSLAFAPLVAPHRPYRLYLPAGHDAGERLPMLVMLHGCQQDVESFAAGTRMNALADRERLVVLYPEQRRLANVHRCWNWFDPSTQRGRGEAAIIAGMVRAVAAKYNVDGSRIWVAGLSAGGAMASILASCHAELFAACAVHSGLMFQAAGSPGAAARAMERGSAVDPQKAGRMAYEISAKEVDAMPAMVVHGDRDERVNPVNADQVIAQFAQMNELALSARDRAFDDVQDRVKVEMSAGGYRYEIHDRLCDGQPLLRKVMIEGLGHAWSGGDGQYPYNDPRGPDANELMWNFFRLHRRAASSGQTTEPAQATSN